MVDQAWQRETVGIQGWVSWLNGREITKLWDCFDSLDDDGSGSIGIEELEDPLIGLGFADTREEVKEIVDSVDDDGSGMIEFPEFLSIIKNSGGNEKSAKIYNFFKNMTSGTFKVQSDSEDDDDGIDDTASVRSTETYKMKREKWWWERIAKMEEEKRRNEEIDKELSFNLIV